MTDYLAPVTRIPTDLADRAARLFVCQLVDGVECDVCDREGPTVYAPEGIDEARDLARALGWHVDTADDLDVCPRCLADGHT